MIVDNIHVQSVFLAIPAAIVYFAFCWRTLKEEGLDWETFGSLLLFTIFPITCLGIGYLPERSITWTILYAVCALVACGTLLVVVIFWDEDSLTDLYGRIFLCSAAACLVFFIVCVPVAILPVFRAPERHSVPPQFDPAVLERSLDGVAEEFASFEQALRDEQKKMSQSFRRLVTEVKDQNTKVQDLQRRKSELEDQLAKYQQVLSLSEDQVRSVESILKRDRHIDYIIGFVLGLVSSTLVALAGFVIRRISSSTSMKRLRRKT